MHKKQLVVPLGSSRGVTKCYQFLGLELDIRPSIVFVDRVGEYSEYGEYRNCCTPSPNRHCQSDAREKALGRSRARALLI